MTLTKMYKLCRPMLQGVPVRIINNVPEMIIDGRSTPIPNRMANDMLRNLPQFVGELVIGKPQSPICYDETLAFLNDPAAVTLWVFWVYDLRTTNNFGLRKRLDILDSFVHTTGPVIQYVDHELIEDDKALHKYYTNVVIERDFPGIVLRDVEATYGAYESETTPEIYPALRESTLLKYVPA